MSVVLLAPQGLWALFSIWGTPYLAGSLPTPSKRPFEGFSHGKQGLPGLLLAFYQSRREATA